MRTFPRGALAAVFVLACGAPPAARDESRPGPTPVLVAAGWSACLNLHEHGGWCFGAWRHDRPPPAGARRLERVFDGAPDMTLVAGASPVLRCACGSSGLACTSSLTSAPALASISGACRAAAFGSAFGCAATDRALSCWGLNFADPAVDRLSFDDANFLPPLDPRRAPYELAAPREPVALAMGARHACALDGQGRVFCWGFDGTGERGAGTAHEGVVEVGVGRASALALGTFHSCVLTADGVWCWGRPRALSCEPPGSETEATEASAALAPCRDPVPRRELAGDFVAITSGSRTTCALERGGALRCFGEAIDGGRGDRVVARGVRAAVQFDDPGDGDQGCVLTEGGTVSCWGFFARLVLGGDAPPEASSPPGVRLFDLDPDTGEPYGAPCELPCPARPAAGAR